MLTAFLFAENFNANCDNLPTRVPIPDDVWNNLTQEQKAEWGVQFDKDIPFLKIRLCDLARISAEFETARHSDSHSIQKVM